MDGDGMQFHFINALYNICKDLSLYTEAVIGFLNTELMYSGSERNGPLNFDIVACQRILRITVEVTLQLHDDGSVQGVYMLMSIPVYCCQSQVHSAAGLDYDETTSSLVF